MKSTAPIMDTITNGLANVNNWLYAVVLIVLLLGAGVYFSIRTHGLQIRHFGKMLSALKVSRKGAQGGISSFQAFAIGLASRVGTGNIAGVAIAITLGGAGAVFWMWVVALIGMSTAFIEATLAQVFKMPWRDGTFRGGPAFYIWKGLKSWRWGAIFAVVLIFTYGFAFEMVQTNTIADTLHEFYEVPTWVTASALAILTAITIFGGVRAVAKVTEWMAPVMAVLYVIVAIAVLIINFDQIGYVFTAIFESAFGLNQAFAGTAGGFLAALLNGVKRGLYSNEAGMGSAPNAASTATTDHPAKQGLIQSLGVFVDTIVVCTATAFIVLSAGKYVPGQDLEAATLTVGSTEASLGAWAVPVMIFLIMVFAFSTVIGNYAYAEVNLDYLSGPKRDWSLWLKLLVVVSAFIGAIAKVSFVWTLADTSMFFMAVINLVAIIRLAPWSIGVLRDFEAHPDRPFVATNNPFMPKPLETEIWVEKPGVGSRG